ncbi:hypothetical protein ACQ86O_24375 [Serratia sp. L9]|uniref:hypothetical protein n=1 Tax=Serratia sp. L9 TaxID=3423946 RepID=UPI003D676114
MSAALIITDLIEDLAGPKGRANHCREQLMARDLIAHVNAAAAYARVRKIPVIWLRTGFADDYHDIPPHSPLFNHFKHIGALRLSNGGCHWLAGLEIKAEDLQYEKSALRIRR